MEIILGIFIGIGLVLLYAWFKIQHLARRLEAHLTEAVDQVKSSLVPVIVERQNGSIYCYAKDDHQFLCQGKNLEEIRQAFELRFPDKTAYLAGGDQELVDELRSAINKDLSV